MTEKYTFLSLCRKYNKIEIPIIQRDYAQGRENESSIRDKFVDFIVYNLGHGNPVDLDFIYGNKETTIGPNNEKILTFVPIDGQQRLTTLWLLHWFLAVKDNCLSAYVDCLSKFTYETRPSAHDFCSRLMEWNLSGCNIKKIDEEITDQEWFDNEWLKDGTVKGMLVMLKNLASRNELLNGKISISLLDEPNNMISFYCVPLENFGLSEDVYIRMNARGKILTKFENFKSEFYKIIKDDPNLEDFKNKIEYQWVTNLWDYRDKDSFVIDKCFMNYLQFITQVLYLRKAKTRDENDYESDFTSFKVLSKVYSNHDNTRKLIYALDKLPEITAVKTGNLLWERNRTSSIADIFHDILCNPKIVTTDKIVITYAALSYWEKQGGDDGRFLDFIRIIRNLIFNTKKSVRDLPNILRSVDKLCNSKDFLTVVRSKNFNLEGFRNSQCKEEHFKALLIMHDPNITPLLHKIEDNEWFCGNIRHIIAAVYTKSGDKIDNFTLEDSIVEKFDKNKLSQIYNGYVDNEKDNFFEIRGELIITPIYFWQKDSGRLVYSSEYYKQGALMSLIRKYSESKLTLEEFVFEIEKKNIRKILRRYPQPEEIRDVKIQLYLLYLITRRVMNRPIGEFFSNGYNFGWLAKEKDFTSLFKKGINDDPWFSEVNPIFQTYSSQFRYNMGLNKKNALPPEIVGNGRPQKPWARLKSWAESDE